MLQLLLHTKNGFVIDCMASKDSMYMQKFL